ncbi:Filamin-interacting protein FAM101B [Sciurus carolinensis]|uniref:Filamin-interacting protein FAM101B n=1 Tax=Sciurus carolinensis TaxID=30640 RepID=A0AA41MVD9_SCICA|nr:Filamin-interacting protein FAM101B [Sciurus carolinensis]
MVGQLCLQEVPDLMDTKKKGDGVLDSPDSGLSPSPSPSHWGLASARVEAAAESAHRLGHWSPLRRTTIVYPKYPNTIYTTTLEYNCHKNLRRFLSSVELEATEFLGSDCLLDEC